MVGSDYSVVILIERRMRTGWSLAPKLLQLPRGIAILGSLRSHQDDTPIENTMTDHLQSVLTHLETSHASILTELIEFAAIPSVSTEPAHAADMESAWQWVAK